MFIIKSFEKKNMKKYCVQLDDESLIETALFEHHGEIHFCLPTQVGCSMRCKHCATTYASKPYIRNLSYNELIKMIELMREQLWTDEYPLILSFSGHGEPMMNWENIQRCASIYCNSFDDIYVTSIGVIDIMNEIIRSMDFCPCIYFSIHGSSDEERGKLIPSAMSINIASLNQIIEFGKIYTQNGGRVVWNYMLCNINCLNESFEQLLALCKKVNYNLELRFTKYIDIHKDNGIKEVEDTAIYGFYQKLLKQLSSNIHVRLSSLEGEEMGIACGQMRAYMQNMEHIK